MAMSAEHRSKFSVKSPYDWNILEWDDKPKTSKQTKQTNKTNKQTNKQKTNVGRMIFVTVIYGTTPFQHPEKLGIAMMTKEGSTKIVNLMTIGVGFLY